MEEIKTIGVIGAGTMGLGIAQIAAMAGYPTILFDANPDAVSDAFKTIEKNLGKGIKRGKVTQAIKSSTLQNLTAVTKLNLVTADLIIEAIIEKLEVKQQLFAQLEDINSTNTILATNTSSISITQIAAKLKRPENVVGLHFFNPAHIMKLVEVISGATTSQQVVNKVTFFAKNTGKTPVNAADSPGFIVNRVARHFYVESLKALEEGVATVEGIDRLMEASGFKMGPFKLMDLIGVDTNFSVTTSMFNAFHQDTKFRPSRIQQQKVDAGHWGQKSGKGFYHY
ncbi:MAG: 3-hydroxyacyl-CoA dehydrogenase NAD-binding domain-containing protein [Cyclobacteriaceae bacterium]|nr:3-hydroxyacyl-CoA dehydrogenase NAD-binding domain-containing protein [Cyclobacteriaceae bacterium]